MKNYDNIDKFFIILISLYLVVLILFLSIFFYKYKTFGQERTHDENNWFNKLISKIKNTKLWHNISNSKFAIKLKELNIVDRFVDFNYRMLRRIKNLDLFKKTKKKDDSIKPSIMNESNEYAGQKGIKPKKKNDEIKELVKEVFEEVVKETKEEKVTKTTSKPKTTTTKKKTTPKKKTATKKSSTTTKKRTTAKKTTTTKNTSTAKKTTSKKSTTPKKTSTKKTTTTKKSKK